jgi:periplasmic protein TonB
MASSVPTRQATISRAAPPASVPTASSAQPERAGPAPAAAPSAPAVVAPISSGWQGALAAWLQTHRVYPEEARENNEQGRVVVRFTVDRDGRVADVALVISSGSRILDTAAQAMLRGAILPPFPGDMPQDHATVTVPIHYSLAP